MRTRLYIISVFTVCWWLAAIMSPSPANTDPMIVQIVLALMGLVFFAGGWIVYLVRQNFQSCLFLVYCCLASIHWAGPPTLAPGVVDELLLGLFIVMGSALMESVFLQLALVCGNARLSQKLLALVYLPPLAGAVLLLAVLFRLAPVDLMLPIYMLGMSWGILAGIAWLVLVISNRIPGIGLAQRWLVGIALVLAWLPNTVATSGLVPVSDYAGLTNLSMLFLLAGIGSIVLQDFRQPD